MAASQPVAYQQRSYEVFEKKHYMECTTLSSSAPYIQAQIPCHVPGHQAGKDTKAVQPVSAVMVSPSWVVGDTLWLVPSSWDVILLIISE